MQLDQPIKPQRLAPQRANMSRYTTTAILVGLALLAVVVDLYINSTHIDVNTESAQQLANMTCSQFTNLSSNDQQAVGKKLYAATYNSTEAINNQMGGASETLNIESICESHGQSAVIYPNFKPASPVANNGQSSQTQSTTQQATELIQELINDLAKISTDIQNSNKQNMYADCYTLYQDTNSLSLSKFSDAQTQNDWLNAANLATKVGQDCIDSPANNFSFQTPTSTEINNATAALDKASNDIKAQAGQQ